MSGRHDTLRARLADLERATGGAIRLDYSYAPGDRHGVRWVLQIPGTSGRTLSTREAEAFVLGAYSGLGHGARPVLFHGPPAPTDYSEFCETCESPGHLSVDHAAAAGRE
jgi:hypothetical protein